MALLAFGGAIFGLVAGFALLVKGIFRRGDVILYPVAAAAGDRGGVRCGLMMTGLALFNPVLVCPMVETDLAHGCGQRNDFGPLAVRRRNHYRRKYQASRYQQHTHSFHLILLKESAAAYSA